MVAAVAVVADDKKDKDIGTVIGIDLGTTYSWWVNLVIFIHWILVNLAYGTCVSKYTYTGGIARVEFGREPSFTL